MTGAIPERNFAGHLLNRLSDESQLIDATTQETIRSSELGRAVRSFAAHLFSIGLRPGDAVIIGCNLSPASGLAYLGAMYAGLVAVPVEESRLVESARALLEQSRARAVWTEERHLDEPNSDSSFRTIHGHPLHLQAATIAPAPKKENELAALMATSGSSDSPRFVMVSHGNLLANTEAIVRSQRLQEDERAMLVLPVSYCFGASVLHTHLYVGGSVVFDRRFMFPDKILQAINLYECTTFAGVPTAYNILLRRSNIRTMSFPALRRFLQAGGPLAPQAIQEMHKIVPTVDLYVMYGQTEATSRISCLDPDDLEYKLGSVGRPLDNVALRIVDEEGRDVPATQAGEILVKGPSVSEGYFNDSEACRRVFRDGWLHTGDLGCLDEDGYLWIRGRKSAFLKVRGVRLDFAEVEARVGKVDGVYECAASAVAHEEAGEALVLYIVPEQNAEGVAERVRLSLPAHWTCESIRLVSEIPKTRNGKIARAVLAAGSRV